MFLFSLLFILKASTTKMNQIYIALSYFIINAVSIVYMGSQRLLTSKSKTGEVTMKDAIEMPIFGSVVLFSLFLAYKFLPVEILNLFLSFYLAIGAIFALAMLIKPFIKPRLITGVFCVAVSVGYVWTNHWVLNNILAYALGVVALQSLSIGTFKAAYVLLSLLFLYDIFWVFGTNVMVTVASQIRGPVLFTFPQTIFGDHTDKSLLGLGDVVVPGLFISQTLIFSQKCVKRGNLYFFVSLCAYVCGVSMTMAVMRFFHRGQPALLYIVPWLLISFSVAVLVCGDGKAAWNFCSSDFLEQEEADNTEELFVLQCLTTEIKEIFGLVKEKKSRKNSVQRRSSLQGNKRERSHKKSSERRK